MWFAKWNLVTYYSHAPADLTLSTTDLTVPLTGSLSDNNGSGAWTTAIDNTLPFGQQLGWLVFNMYERQFTISTTAAVNLNELELYGIAAEDILIRELTPDQIKAAVIEMRKIVTAKYNASTPTRQLILASSD